MSSTRTAMFVLSVVLLVFAPEKSYGDEALTLKLEKGAGAGATLSKDASASLAKGATQVDTLTTLQILCTNLDCKDKVKAFVTVGGAKAEAKVSEAPAASAAQVTVVIPPKAEKLHVEVDGVDVFTTTFKVASKKPDQTGDDDVTQTRTDETMPRTLQDLVDIACNAPEDLVNNYDGAKNNAIVRVSLTGTPQTPISREFDENDTLTVLIHADPRLLPMLRVRRKSAFAVPGGKILGANVALPGFVTQADEKEPTFECETRAFVVGNFEAGKGEVEISARVGSSTVVLGTFEFAVAPVYSGMFTFGAVWTPLIDPKFEVAEREGQRVIIAGETGSRRMSYVLLYTPFLWDRLERDVRKPSAAWYKHINPTVGFVLDDPLDNVLAGISADFSGAIALSAGAYFSHVSVLDGVSVGDAFDGETSALPVTKRWKRDWFFGVTIDLRTATSLVRTVLGTAAGGGS